MGETPDSAELRKAIVDALVEVINLTGWPRLRDIFVERHWARKKEAIGNPLVRCGEKFFSQNDEDGILLEILRRTGLRDGVFVEIGVGNGLENNTLILLMNGWQGVWLGNEPLAFEVPEDGPLVFQQSWVTRDNCCSLVSHGLGALGGRRVNVLSVDIDGNDLYVIGEILASGLAPDVVVAEYNGKFPPPIRWSIAYDENHVWDGSDYMGASLQSLVDEIGKYDYRLVACNLTGVNAFFVRNAHAAAFKDVPTEPARLFVGADNVWFLSKGHQTSPRTILQALRQDQGKP
jgi:hypothetical protein